MGKLKQSRVVGKEGHGINGCSDKKDPAQGRATAQTLLATVTANPRFALGED
jgi:hypothetical protein